MARAPRNSIAAALSAVTTIVMWLAIVFGLVAFLVLGIGFIASLQGGETNLSGLHALADGVSPATFVFGLCNVAIIVPGIVYICLQLRRILSTLAEGDPFVPENAPRLGRVAIAIAVMELLRYLAVFVAMSVPGIAGNAEPRLSINLILWASVAALFVLSQVFREGTRLREEEKMTI